MEDLRRDCKNIEIGLKESVLPYDFVKKILNEKTLQKKIHKISTVKVPCIIAKVAYDFLGENIPGSLALSKYEHCKRAVGNIKILEAGQAVPDKCSLYSTEYNLASAGCHGTAGQSDFSGFLLDGITFERIGKSGKIAESISDNNDSYSVLKNSDDRISTVATDTNVNELMLLLIK